MVTLVAFLAVTSMPAPPTFGFYAVQCKRTREVVCIDDADMAMADCDILARQSINTINGVIGREVFHFAGFLHTQEGALNAIRHGVLVIVGVPARLGNTLAYTHPEVTIRGQTACIDEVFIVLTPAAAAGRDSVAIGLVIHELLHALGAEHADPDSHYHSIMSPAIHTTASTDSLTESDARALREVYGP